MSATTTGTQQAERRGARSGPFTMRLRRGQVCVAEGFGIRIRVNRQHLVIDDGLGIPLDKQDRLFEPFQRAGHDTISGTRAAES